MFSSDWIKLVNQTGSLDYETKSTYIRYIVAASHQNKIDRDITGSNFSSSYYLPDLSLVHIVCTGQGGSFRFWWTVTLPGLLWWSLYGFPSIAHKIHSVRAIRDTFEQKKQPPINPINFQLFQLHTPPPPKPKATIKLLFWMLQLTTHNLKPEQKLNFISQSKWPLLIFLSVLSKQLIPCTSPVR